MGEEIVFENGRISNLQGIVTLTLDRVILHTVIHTKFHEIEATFLWMATYCQLQSHVTQPLGHKS